MAKQTKQEVVYQYIYDHIFNCAYPPGTSLTEEGLCQELNVSRTPVREAIRRLSAEGLLEFTPGIGLSVAQIRLDDLLEIYELRLGLECLAARLFIEKHNPDLLHELSECVELLDQSVKEDNIDLFMQNDMRFHRLICHGARNRRLTAELEIIYGHIYRMSNYVRMDEDIRRSSVVEHRQILDALKSGDIDTAVHASEAHCMSGRRYYLKRLYNI